MTSKAVADKCEANGVNVRVIDDKTVGLSFGESITKDDVAALVRATNQAPGWSDGQMLKGREEESAPARFTFGYTNAL